MEKPYSFKLPNGIRIVYQQVSNTRIIHAGVVLDVGTRDENSDTQGITHFWEHMVFKGTKRRSAHTILNSVESVGGELNAFTDKEKVVLFASARDTYFERMVDLLADITFNSVFSEKHIKKECGVILEEMAMYFDNPDDSLQDEFESLVFKNHPMGMNILGRPETITSFQRKDFLNLFRSHLDTNRIVFSCVGSLQPGKVEAIARKYFNVKPLQRTTKRVKAKKYLARQKELFRPVKQARCAIGRETYSVRHENRIPFYLLVNMLGGPGMNSRLNMALREKHGYVYSIDAHYNAYSDTGLFSIFFGTEPRQLERCIALVHHELERFCSKKLSKRQLNAAKEQLKGQMAMAEENNLNLMLMMGRATLDYNRVPLLEEIFEVVNQTDETLLMNIAQEMFDIKNLSCLKILPKA